MKKFIVNLIDILSALLAACLFILAIMCNNTFMSLCFMGLCFGLMFLTCNLEVK